MPMGHIKYMFGDTAGTLLVIQASTRRTEAGLTCEWDILIVVAMLAII